MFDFVRARQHMVQSQIGPNGVIDPMVLDAFLSVPREEFVPDNARSFSYTDKEIDLGEGRFMLEPMVLARMIEALGPVTGKHVLSVAGSTGYGAAILVRLGADVTLFETDLRFREQCQKAFQESDLVSPVYIIGDLRQGFQSDASYDAILVEGAVADDPFALAHLLKCGGRLVAILVQEGGRMGQATLIEKSMSGFLSSRPLFDAFAAYIPGWEPVSRFSFV